MPGVEVWLLALPVAGLFLHRVVAGRVTCPVCGGRRCSFEPVVHLVTGSEGDRTTAHRCRTCRTDFVLIGGDPTRPHIAQRTHLARR